MKNRAAFLWGTSAMVLVLACGTGEIVPARGNEGRSANAGSAPDDPAGPASRGERFSFNPSGWQTDFSRHIAPLQEITSGGPSKDGIPPVDRPKFLPVGENIDWLHDNEPVVALNVKEDARAYPLQILIWHEIVNDSVGGTPVLVTFCPLCNSAIAFDRRVDGAVHDFGTTGNLRYSDLVMYDRQTQSWWQQITGEAIVGELTGKKLVPLPASIVSWKAFKTAHSTGKVLSRETGFLREYGRNPYVGYDDIHSSPFLFDGFPDTRLPPKERVITVTIGGEDAAYRFDILEQRKVINDRVGGTDIVVFWAEGTVSALDNRDIYTSQDVGAAAVYEAAVSGNPLVFEAAPDGTVRDKTTGSTWSLFGKALKGPLAGAELTPVVHGNQFWFAWAAFKPTTRIYYP